jgi:hypothetical protein
MLREGLLDIYRATTATLARSPEEKSLETRNLDADPG